MKRLLPILLLVFSVGVGADDGVKAKAAVLSGDYQTAIKLYLPYAEAGASEAQYNIGYAYERLRRFTEAIYWYRKAAEAGQVKAQFSLAQLYDFAVGVPEDNAEAARWYTKAAENSHPKAQNNLATLYVNGDGVTQNYKKSLYWYKKAMMQGHGSAAWNVANHYRRGLGVSKNPSMVYAYRLIAKTLGFKRAIKLFKIAEDYRQKHGESIEPDHVVKEGRVFARKIWAEMQAAKAN